MTSIGLEFIWIAVPNARNKPKALENSCVVFLPVQRIIIRGGGDTSHMDIAKGRASETEASEGVDCDGWFQF